MKTFFILVLLICSSGLFAQKIDLPKSLATYYHQGKDFSWHHEVASYFKELEKLYPEQVRIESYGQTYEGRPLFLVYLGSKNNIKQIDDIKRAHKNRTDETAGIVWLSYNVHGNESCGTEAAMETAYLLLTEKSNYLEHTLVIMDPCLNPDGRDRYVNFYKQYHGKNTILDRRSAEHDETWPGGRPNHYFFDLNRDWAWLTQIESASRLPKYNAWLPHVHVDFHEQSMNEPYYFPPAAEPYHQVITPWQRTFQKTIGDNHASYFDKQGWLFFSKEIFDLLYPSYGDTYPTYNGAIGMTYEQGGSGRAGLSVITNNMDTLTLADRIAHHVTTGLSTVEMVEKHHLKLIQEFQNYFSKAPDIKYQSYVLDGASPLIQSLLVLLDKHQISYKIFDGKTSMDLNGFDFFTKKNTKYTLKENDVVVRAIGEKARLTSVLFEPSTYLSDSLTYDITAWSLPYVYGISTIASEKPIEISSGTKEPRQAIQNTKPYGYAIEWNGMNGARFLSEMLQNNIKVETSEIDFQQNGKDYKKGTLLILRNENNTKPIDKIMETASREYQLSVSELSSGKVDKGGDFGSSVVKYINAPKVGLISGEASSLSVGEIWHFLDVQLNYPVHFIRKNELNQEDLDGLDVLFIPEGISLPSKSSLNEWIEKGGTCIVMGNGASEFQEEYYGITVKDEEQAKEQTGKGLGNYGQMERQSIKESIIGAVYKCELDLSHPLNFGYTNPYFTLKLAPDVYSFEGNIVQKIVDKEAWISGFAGSEVKQKQMGATTVGTKNIGDGCIVFFFDNPLFRSFWENGKLQVANAIFLLNK